ncbi:hypothetical protein TTHERM_000420289 (macronuclear) [Tetrahymena thermophila SB210]|uniref:Uncharacterized protein n=1 Tax=Tetrahymena thermophila (strain SB210) TaxID=312017 RepID=W7XF78_TETTS|nr:hypothetical protein TTHERM_000420289 [Tetrahymena thermophila SB210]EWS72646.1 hypothetical protein TTHERM_000420289 [Tetrahymena thermophila SB210]|eukprot:XP_012654814.1 hypothetical protein TTHERM_000420289 [Tetrahymena thermophila SB210]
MLQTTWYQLTLSFVDLSLFENQKFITSYENVRTIRAMCLIQGVITDMLIFQTYSVSYSKVSIDNLLMSKFQEKSWNNYQLKTYQLVPLSQANIPFYKILQHEQIFYTNSQ